MSERPHKKLELWKFVIRFIGDIYQLTNNFPEEEKFGLVSQLRRASVSIASNIAEGSARKGHQEKIQFFIMARASLSEIDAQLEISLHLGFISNKDYEISMENLDRISRMLQGLIESYNTR
jgi:four helix bundle protein